MSGLRSLVTLMYSLSPNKQNYPFNGKSVSHTLISGLLKQLMVSKSGVACCLLLVACGLLLVACGLLLVACGLLLACVFIHTECDCG